MEAPAGANGANSMHFDGDIFWSFKIVAMFIIQAHPSTFIQIASPPK
jgi:hypothetical protein